MTNTGHHHERDIMKNITWEVEWTDEDGIDQVRDADDYGQPFEDSVSARKYGEELLDKGEATEVSIHKVMTTIEIQVIETIMNDDSGLFD
jgi:hypothetical protein